MWEVEYTDEFEVWWNELGEAARESTASYVGLLEEFGPGLGFPHTSAIIGSRYSHMRELRIQHQGRPYRVMFAFDPRRCAILLIGGEKTGDDRWYEKTIRIADALYEIHLIELQGEGLIDG